MIVRMLTKTVIGKKSDAHDSKESSRFDKKGNNFWSFFITTFWTSKICFRTSIYHIHLSNGQVGKKVNVEPCYSTVDISFHNFKRKTLFTLFIPLNRMGLGIMKLKSSCFIRLQMFHVKFVQWIKWLAISSWKKLSTAKGL